MFNAYRAVILILLASGSNVSGFFTSSQKSNNSLFGYGRLCSALSQKKNDFDTTAKFLSRQNVLKVISGTIVSVPLLLETYARSGSVQTVLDIFNESGSSGTSTFTSSTSPNSIKDVRDITIIFHGAGGQDVNTDELLKVFRDRIELSSKKNKNAIGVVKMVDWEVDSGDILKASVKGSKIGARIGRMLTDLIQNNSNSGDVMVRNIHIIGISVGAFPADSLIQTLNSELNERTRKSTYLQLTMLDPFQQKAVLGVNYGNSNFGKGADYAEQYLNTDDPVPSTNDQLQHCATIDVTSLRPTEVFGHDWPLIYYSNRLKNPDSAQLDDSEGAIGIVPIEKRRKIGSLEIL